MANSKIARSPKRTKRTPTIASLKAANARSRKALENIFAAAGDDATPDESRKFTGTFAELEQMVDKVRAERAPVIPPRPESAWADGRVNPEASLMTLTAALFSDFDGDARDPQPLAFLSGVLRAGADDIEMMQAADGALDHSEAMTRSLGRIESRSRLAVEIAKRMQAGAL